MINQYINIIFFPIAYSTGYGIIIVLSILFSSNLFSSNNLIFILDSKLLIVFLSLFLIYFSSGYYLMYFNKFKEELSINKLSSKWLSIKIILTIIIFFPLITFYYLWIFENNSNLKYIFAFVSSLLSILAIYSASKINFFIKLQYLYDNPLIPILNILNSIVLGSLIIFTILFYYKIYNNIIFNLILIIFPTTLFIKLLYWYSIKKKKNEDFLFETEISQNINEIKYIYLRFICCICAYITPVFCIIQQPYLVLSHKVALITVYLTLIIATIGMFIERWLFIIESTNKDDLKNEKNKI